MCCKKGTFHNKMQIFYQMPAFSHSVVRPLFRSFMTHLYLRDSYALQVECVMTPAVMLNISIGSIVVLLNADSQKHREAALLYKEDKL